MFVNEEDFHFTVSELRRHGYIFTTGIMDTYIYIYGKCTHHSVMIVLSTQAPPIFENVSGRIAACPTRFMDGWGSYVPITLRLPRSILEVSYFVKCLEKLEKDNSLWRKNSTEQINTYDYETRYQLK